MGVERNGFGMLKGNPMDVVAFRGQRPSGTCGVDHKVKGGHCRCAVCH